MASAATVAERAMGTPSAAAAAAAADAAAGKAVVAAAQASQSAQEAASHAVRVMTEAATRGGTVERVNTARKLAVAAADKAADAAQDAAAAAADGAAAALAADAALAAAAAAEAAAVGMCTRAQQQTRQRPFLLMAGLGSSHPEPFGECEVHCLHARKVCLRQLVHEGTCSCLSSHYAYA